MNWLRRFMIGRYGADQLMVAMVAVSFVCLLLSRLTGWGIFYWVAFVLLVWAYLRMLSRNTGRRYAENQKFLQFWRPLGGRLRGVIQRLQSGRDYCYFKCPHCGQKVRVPRGRGKIEVTCQKCHTVFRTKT